MVVVVMTPRDSPDSSSIALMKMVMITVVMVTMMVVTVIMKMVTGIRVMDFSS